MIDHNKFEYMTESLSRKFIVDKLDMDFEIINSFRTIRNQLPPISCVDHVRVLDKDMASMEIPSRDQ